MTVTAYLVEQIAQSRQFLEGTMAGVTPAHLAWMPSGKALPIGALYAHGIFAEDMIIANVLQGKAPLCGTTWAGTTGASEMMPALGPAWVEYEGWARRVKIDLDALRRYAEAVRAQTDAYLESLDDSELKRRVDLRGIGMGEVTVAWVIGMLIIGHTYMISGEISCLKGMQGEKGYPL